MHRVRETLATGKNVRDSPKLAQESPDENLGKRVRQLTSRPLFDVVGACGPASRTKKGPQSALTMGVAVRMSFSAFVSKHSGAKHLQRRYIATWLNSLILPTYSKTPVFQGVFSGR